MSATEVSTGTPTDAPPDSTHATIRLGDPSLRLLLLVAFVFQLLTWGQLQGYQLADSVEYMERAQALVRGQEVLDSVAIRSFGFASLFAPLFALADVFGVEDFSLIVGLARLLQMLLGLELIRITVQIGARLAGRRAGLVAGLTVALIPHFLLYSASPVSGIASGVCIGHALYRLIFRVDFRGALIGGLWLGGALLMAYKTVLIALPLIGLLFVADRFVRWRSWAGASCGYGLGILGAIGLDKLCYGTWGRSLDLYFRENFGHVAARLSFRAGFTDLALWFWEYRGGEASAYTAAPETVPEGLANEPNPLYHLTHLYEVVAWPLLALGLVALGYCLLRGKRPARILAVVFLISIAAVSLKKSQDLRLLLPSLACIGVLCGLGWQLVFGRVANRRVGTIAGALVVAAAGLLGWQRLGEINNTTYAGYWQAMERVNQLAAGSAGSRAPGADLRVACTWHWSVYLRESADVDLIKLPHQLDRWPALGPEARRADLEALSELDLFLTHLAVLLGSPDLFEAVNQRFEVDAVLYDRELFGSLGPIVILARRTGAPGARSFQERTTGVAPADYVRERELEPGCDLTVAGEDSMGKELRLLGWKYEALPGNGHGWLSLHWLRSPAATERAYLVRPRLLTSLVELPWEEQHQLGRGFESASEWGPGEILSEGWPVVAAVAPFDATRPWQPLTADQPPGSIVPATFWLRVIPLTAEGQEGAALVPLTPAGEAALTVTVDGFIRIGELSLVVPGGRR